MAKERQIKKKYNHMKLRYVCIALVLLVGSACERMDRIPELNFDVVLDSTTFRAGDEVIFHLKGDPGIIAFYSGEQGNDYAYRNQPRIDYVEELNLRFETHNQELTPYPERSWADFRVKVSMDFNGTYDYASVTSSTWIDITDRFTLSAPDTWASGNTVWIQSGIRNISDVIEPGSTFYIAFHYHSPERTTGGNMSRRWRMRSFNLSSLTTSGATRTLGTYAPANWVLVSPEDPRTSQSQLAASIMLFAPRANNSPEAVDEWGVSRGFSADEVNLGHEFGVAIKGYGDARLPDYGHVYNTPGTYTATFVAKNANIAEEYETVRQVEIKVLP